MGEPELYFADASRYMDEELFSQAFEKLSTWRKEKAARIKFQSGKRLSVAAGTLLESVLKQKGVDPSRVTVSRAGKPELPGNPFYFSLSHKNAAAVLAVSNRPVGVDIEFSQPKDYSESMIRRFYFPAEKEALSAVRDPDRRIRLFFRMWTVKEAYGKYCGTGIKDALKMDSVNPFSSVRFFYPDCPVGSDYIVTLCVPKN